MVLLPLLQGLLQPRLDLLPKLVAFARLTFMEKPEQPQDVLHVRLAVPVLVKLLPLPPSMLLVSAQKTAMLPLQPLIILEDALHALINVSLLLLAKLLLLLASAPKAHGPHLEAMTILHALIALLVLLPMELESLPLLIATARLAFMELAAPLLARALHVIMKVPLLLRHPPLPLSLLIANAKPTPTEQQWTMVPHAQIALLALLLVPTKMHAVAKLVSTG